MIVGIISAFFLGYIFFFLYKKRRKQQGILSEGICYNCGNSTIVERTHLFFWPPWSEFELAYCCSKCHKAWRLPRKVVEERIIESRIKRIEKDKWN